MSKHHTPLIDDFVNELLGDESELSDAANQDHPVSTDVQTDQTSTTHAETTEDQTVQTSPHTEPEVEAVEEKPEHPPAPAEIEASTVVENITLDDYARATAVIENFRANVGQPDTRNTEKTAEPADQTSTQAEPEMQAVEELSVEDHSQETAPEHDDIAASVAVNFDEELPQETTLSNSKADTEQTMTATDSEAVADESEDVTAQAPTPVTTQATIIDVPPVTEEPPTAESRDSIDPDVIAASVIADFDAEFPSTAADEAASAPSTEETPAEAPDPEAIAASVIADFEAEFPTQGDTASDNAATDAAPDPDDIAASVIADFDAEFPTESETPGENQPATEADDIAAAVIADFDAEFPTESDTTETSTRPAIDPDALAASVIEDFEAEFPTDSEATDPVATSVPPSGDNVEATNDIKAMPTDTAKPAPAVDQGETAPTEDQFLENLQRWMQPPAVIEEETTVDYTLRCVSFTLQGQTYATEVQTLLEVLEHADIVPIPSMSHPILGIFNLRGNIVPVVDPSLLLGLPPTDASDKQLLVAEYKGGAVALPISTVSEVVNIEQTAIQKAPQASAHIIGLAPVHDEMLTLLDLAKLVSTTLGDKEVID